ncbi:methyltransferase domain-containing protein [Kitasatospora sp. NPDC058218]|uniref:methyltransferase domain-containing protein n=1 Tax=Kitasatospora sp. NPDC058218 TaxID=3346385 RepID=UPI0036DE10D3
MRPPAAHGFTAVDQQPRPAAFVQVLDTLDDHPFYAAYKARLRELLHARPGDRFLDIGAGTGDSVQGMAREYGSTVAAIDRSTTMARHAHARGLAHVAVADAHHLPFRDASFDGAWADRVLQHVADPEQVLTEMLRVIRPGGRIALADPDYDTQVLDIADQELARRVLRFRADVQLRHGTLAHRHAGLLARRGLLDVSTEARTLVVRDPREADNCLGLRTWARTAAEHGHLTRTEAEQFTGQFDEAVRSGRFTYAVTFFLTAATAAPTSRS